MPRYGAPLPEGPRNLQAVGAVPCELLTNAHLGQLGLRPQGEPRLVADMAPACVWQGSGLLQRVSVAVWLDRDYFVDVYRNHFLPVFRSLDVTGLPIVEQQSGPASPFCTTTVGVAESQALEISASVDEVEGQPAIDPCAEGRRVVEAIVPKLPLK